MKQSKRERARAIRKKQELLVRARQAADHRVRCFECGGGGWVRVSGAGWIRGRRSVKLQIMFNCACHVHEKAWRFVSKPVKNDSWNSFYGAVGGECGANLPKFIFVPEHLRGFSDDELALAVDAAQMLKKPMTISWTGRMIGKARPLVVPPALFSDAIALCSPGDAVYLNPTNYFGPEVMKI